MPYIPPDVVAKAREMDLLTYLRNYEPNELVHFAGSTYCTRDHDSLKISNGKWYWFSRGIGGYNALDYLIKVKEMPFTDAVETIMGHAAVQPPIRASTPTKKESPRVLLLPQANPNADRIVSYLAGRGIDREIICWCIQTGRLYESYPHHNVVFVGLDKYNKARYGNLRGCGTDFKGEATGSDKRFSFSIPAPGSDTLHLFEGAVDLLSYLLCRKYGIDVSGYDFSRLPEGFRETDPQSVRAALTEMRDTANTISGRMYRVLEQNKAPKSKEQER